MASSVHYLFLHPLAKFPGPFFSKFSVWPSWYHTIKGNRHIWIWQCHQLYGPAFRYCPDGVLFNTSTAARTIYDAKANVIKGPVYKVWPQEAGTVNTWTCRDKAKHARKRRILNAAFSDKSLKSSEPYIIQHADRWCELLVEGSTRGWSEPRNMTHWSDCLVFDILGELCYAKSFDIKEPGQNELKLLPKLIGEFLMLLYVVRVKDSE